MGLADQGANAPRRQDASLGLTKLYRGPPCRARWPAVGDSLEMGTGRLSHSKWLGEKYPVIAACAKVDRAQIHCGDETGQRSVDVSGRSDAPQGQTPVVRYDNKRQGLSVISAVNNQSQMR
jgi:hypothetical protein